MGKQFAQLLQWAAERTPDMFRNSRPLSTAGGKLELWHSQAPRARKCPAGVLVNLLA